MPFSIRPQHCTPPARIRAQTSWVLDDSSAAPVAGGGRNRVAPVAAPGAQATDIAAAPASSAIEARRGTARVPSIDPPAGPGLGAAARFMTLLDVYAGPPFPLSVVLATSARRPGARGVRSFRPPAGRI